MKPNELDIKSRVVFNPEVKSYVEKLWEPPPKPLSVSQLRVLANESKEAKTKIAIERIEGKIRDLAAEGYSEFTYVVPNNENLQRILLHFNLRDFKVINTLVDIITISWS
jgi:hypothetical protein